MIVTGLLLEELALGTYIYIGLFHGDFVSLL